MSGKMAPDARSHRVARTKTGSFSIELHPVGSGMVRASSLIGEFQQPVRLTGIEKGFLLIGGFADYDEDGVMDFWVTQPQRLGPGPDNRFGWASLILSKEIQRTNTSQISIPNIAKFTLTGSAQFSDYDGIGTSVSLRSGDTNGDGFPDFSISGHRHLNEAGAMFLVSGKGIMRSRTMNATDARIAKIRGGR
jgi:hypothetical protein